MEIEEWVALFTTFLGMNNALEPYLRNLNDPKVTHKRHGGMVGVRENCRYSWVNHAFKWSSTVQGFNYWSDLHDQWRGVCEDVNN